MTKGIHHITAIASDPQNTYDFYSKILGLRLVKKTVNQDDPETYHLFFGDRYGHPGMDLTFFTFQPVQQGKRGNGQVTKISFSVPVESLNFWRDRFSKFRVKQQNSDDRIVFYDIDDQQLELVGVKKDGLEQNNDVWETDEVTKENAIRSFYSATLHAQHKSLVEPILLYALGYELVGNESNVFTYKIKNSKRAAFLEIIVDTDSGYGMSGSGTVHHIAFRVENLEEETKLREKLISIGLIPTEVIDRFYFKSVYFRTPAGILFEIATDGPGFTADQDEQELGKTLSLPPFLESQRHEIEGNLTPIKTD